MTTIARLRLLFAAQGVALGFLMPFVVPLLADRGLDPVAIGLVLGAGAVLSLLSIPVLGALADGPVGRERSVVVTGLMGAAAGLAMLLAGSDGLLVGAAVAAVFLGVAPWMPIMDAIALGALGDGARAYGSVRLWASAGWAASALAGGALYAVVGSDSVVVGFIAASVLVAALAWRPGQAGPAHPGLVASPVRAMRRWRRRRTTGADRRAPGLRSSLRASPILLPFLLAVFLEALGNTAGVSFVSLRILDIGGGPVLIGAAAALPAVIEIPFFRGTSALTARLGLRLVFVIANAVAAVQWVIIAVAPEPVVVAAARSVDGAAYALRYAAIVLIVGACLPDRLRATGQSLIWVVGGGLAAILAGPVAGAVYAGLGSTAMLLGCAAVFAAAGVIGWQVLQGPAFGPRGALAGPAPALPPTALTGDADEGA